MISQNTILLLSFHLPRIDLTVHVWPVNYVHPRKSTISSLDEYALEHIFPDSLYVLAMDHGTCGRFNQFLWWEYHWESHCYRLTIKLSRKEKKKKANRKYALTTAGAFIFRVVSKVGVYVKHTWIWQETIWTWLHLHDTLLGMFYSILECKCDVLHDTFWDVQCFWSASVMPYTILTQHNMGIDMASSFGVSEGYEAPMI